MIRMIRLKPEKKVSTGKVIRDAWLIIRESIARFVRVTMRRLTHTSIKAALDNSPPLVISTPVGANKKPIDELLEDVESLSTFLRWRRDASKPGKVAESNVVVLPVFNRKGESNVQG